MSIFQIKMPKLGESITEGTIINWSVKEGDIINEDDILFEVTTAKVNAEVPSPVDGKLLKIMFKEGETVPVGETVAEVLMGVDSDDSEKTVNNSEIPTSVSQSQSAIESIKNENISDNNQSVTKEGTKITEVLETTNSKVSQSAIKTEKTESRWYSPIVLQLAQQAGISIEELDSVPGSGFLNRLSKKDIVTYIENKKKGILNNSESNQIKSKKLIPAGQTINLNSQEQISGNLSNQINQQNNQQSNNLNNQQNNLTSTPSISSGFAENEIKEMDAVRKIIADRMVQSKKISAHVTTVVEVDVTKLVMWRNKNKDAFKQQEGISLTYLPAIVEATTKALKEFPTINASIEGYNVILKKNINVGIAVSLDNGNLIVPVIHNADKLSISGLAQAIDTQAKKARSNRLKPSDIEGGTFTITNFGTFKNIIGTPIINQPEVAILGVGYIEKKPAVVETPEGDVIAIRHKMYLSLSYDHRLIDGSLGGAFVKRIADILENWG